MSQANHATAAPNVGIGINRKNSNAGKDVKKPAQKSIEVLKEQFDKFDKFQPVPPAHTGLDAGKHSRDRERRKLDKFVPPNNPAEVTLITLITL